MSLPLLRGARETFDITLSYIRHYSFVMGVLLARIDYAIIMLDRPCGYVRFSLVFFSPLLGSLVIRHEEVNLCVS